MNWVEILLLFYVYCQALSDDLIPQNRTKRTVYPVWKPPPNKAYDLCGFELKDNATCKLPPWCAGGVGRCCRYECVCHSRLNPCASGKWAQHEGTPPKKPEHGGECVLECMKKCYKTCLDGKKKPEECEEFCAPGCQSQCGGR
ncbi:uncharacterized protein LOC119459656 [Dermacentor silvarum]|uniref:uncharacterized protein LOC119459656 n=1 Tax=Dermacentor silvarum TaxID=543639 RepID=UPI0021019951|nr:uncharacterized protein LOC119459656 [Dermacentor silvarum]